MRGIFAVVLVLVSGCSLIKTSAAPTPEEVRAMNPARPVECNPSRGPAIVDAIIGGIGATGALGAATPSVGVDGVTRPGSLQAAAVLGIPSLLFFGSSALGFVHAQQCRAALAAMPESEVRIRVENARADALFALELDRGGDGAGLERTFRVPGNGSMEIGSLRLADGEPFSIEMKVTSYGEEKTFQLDQRARPGLFVLRYWFDTALDEPALTPLWGDAPIDAVPTPRP